MLDLFLIKISTQLLLTLYLLVSCFRTTLIPTKVVVNPVASDNSSFSPWTALWIEVIPILQELTVFFIDRQNPVKSCENGTQKIRILVPGKNENCQWLVELLQLRSQIGSKTGDNEIERQKEGKNLLTYTMDPKIF